LLARRRALARVKETTMRRLALVLSVVFAAPLSADTVYLKNGGKLSGVVVAQDEASVEIEVGAGRVTMPTRLVARIERGESPLSRYQARARALDANDVAGWLDLADWAHAAELSSQAREAYEHVLTVDPGNASAHRGLEHRRVGEQWLSHDEAMIARGFVFFEGQWVTREQRDATLQQQEAERRERIDTEAARLALATAEAQAREAEARARTAEAEAERAENPPASVVVGPGYGYGVPGVPILVDPPRGRDHEHRRDRDDRDPEHRRGRDDNDGPRHHASEPAATPTPRPVPKNVVRPPAGVASLPVPDHP
jgi:hypothetical protein